MEARTSEESYRVELMRLREKVVETRNSYRIAAVLLGLGALLFLVRSEEAAWAQGVPLASVSLASVFAYRDCMQRPRFWALTLAVVWTIAVLASLVVGWSFGEFDSFNFERVWKLVFGLGIAAVFWGSVPSRESEALIEEHREEWLAYSAGESLSARERKAARAAARQAD